MSGAETLFLSHPFWIWLALGAVFLVAELLSGSGWLLWPAFAAAATALVALVHPLGWAGEWLLFALVGIAATYLGRRLFPRLPAGGADINDPAPRLIGRQGETVAAFERGAGRVFVDGKEWAAELDGGGDLPARRRIEVVAVLGGARLKVRAA